MNFQIVAHREPLNDNTAQNKQLLILNFQAYCL